MSIRKLLRAHSIAAAIAAATTVLLTGCVGGAATAPEDAGKTTLHLVGYAVPKEANNAIQKKSPLESVLVTLTRAEATALGARGGRPGVDHPGGQRLSGPDHDACAGTCQLCGVGAATHVQLEVVVPARVVVVLLVALLHPFERTFGLFASLVGTEPVSDLGVVVVRHHLMGLEIEPPIALSHLTLLRATPHARISTVLLRPLPLKAVINHLSPAEFDVVGDHFLRS
jgi:hypothetical protein